MNIINIISKIIACIIVIAFVFVCNILPAMILAWLLMHFFPQITFSYTQVAVIIILIGVVIKKLSNK